MPIYEFQCDACGESFEALRKISDPPLDACKLCGDASVRRLVSAPAFRLKGGGWYETDFKKDGKKNLHQTEDKPADKPAADKSKDAGKDKAGGDKQPAAKPAAEATSTKPKAGATSG